MTTTTTTPRVWIACLAAYNNGELHGDWVDLDGLDAEDLDLEIQTILASSPQPGAEEWAIFDHEGFHGLSPGENPDLGKLVELVELLVKHGAAFAGYVNMVGEDYATANEFRETFIGEYASEVAYAEELADETGNLSEFAQKHFDYKSYAHELFIDSVFSTGNPTGGVFVYHKH